MFHVQSAASSGAPSLIPHCWDAYPVRSEGAGAGGGGGGASSARLLRCFLSLPSSSPLSLSPSCSANEGRGTRRRRGRHANNKRMVHTVGSRVQVTSNSSSGGGSGGAALAAAATASSPEVLPEWLGRLGLDKEEEDNLVAAFAALPEPPPPAAADAKLMHAARDLVVSMKKQERAVTKAKAKAGSPNGGIAVEAEKKIRTREQANKAGSALGAESGQPEEVKEGKEGARGKEAGGSAELKSAARAARAGGSPEVDDVLMEAKEPLTEEAAGARDAWMQQRLGLDDAAMATMRETHTHVCSACIRTKYRR